MFDVDEHPGVSEAVALAQRNGVGIALTNPCVELWFILHFEDQTAHLERKPAQDRSRALPACDKALTPAALDALAQRFGDAADRARRLDDKHVGDGSPPGTNPSSGVWRLMDAIRHNIDGG